MSSRDRILERRAKFISTALVLAAGCSRERNIVTKVPDGEGAKPVPSAVVPAVKPGPVPAPPDRPSFDVKVSAAGVEHRDQVVGRLKKLHEEVGKLAGSVPAPCSLDQAECKAAFTKLADEMARIQEDELQHLFPRCPAKTPDDKAVEKVITEHAAWLRTWLDAIDKAARSAVLGADAGAEWDALMGSASAAHPQPCLKYYCP